MISAHLPAKEALAMVLGLCINGPLAAQPLCDVLLRPAFNYSTAGLSVTVEDSSTSFGQNASAQWDFGDGSPIGTTPQHDFTTSGTYEVCLTLTATETTCASTYCRQVIVPLDDCGGALDARFDWYMNGTNSAVFTDASLAAFSGTRLWEFGDGTSSLDPAPEHTWLLPGPHFVTLTRTQGACTATFGTWVEVDGNAGTCGPGLFVDFSATSEGSNTTFQPVIEAVNVFPVISIWSFGDGVVDTTEVGSHLYPNAGSFQTCLLIGALAPPDGDTCFSLVCRTADMGSLTSIDGSGPGDLRAWPNPFSSDLWVSMEGQGGPRILLIRDALGRVVLQVPDIMNGLLHLPTGHLPDGTYFVEALTGTGRRRTMMVKTHP